jgi:hypothetical protein
VIDQVGILGLGMSAIYLVNHPNSNVVKYGCICGLLAQPFWFWTSFGHEQWGIFFSSFVYAWSWMRGVNNHWIKPWRLKCSRR